MIARDARVSAFGDGARFVEAAEVMPDLRDALLQTAILGSFVFGEVLGRVAAPIGESWRVSITADRCGWRTTPKAPTSSRR